MANIQPLVDALNALVAGQQVAGFSKHIKAPEVFKPETRGDEVQKWQDWKFAFENFVGVVDPTMAQEMKDAAQKSDEIFFFFFSSLLFQPQKSRILGLFYWAVSRQ